MIKKLDCGNWCRSRWSRLVREREDGSASVVLIAVIAAIVLVASGFVALGHATAARHAAQGAADAAALASAARLGYEPDVACEAAAEVANANGVALEECLVDGVTVTVHMSAEPAGWAAMLGSASAVSRAGPAIADD